MPRSEQFQDTAARLWPPASLRDKAGRRVLARPVTLCVTNACQLRCSYCYEVHKGDRFMAVETARKFIDMVLTGSGGMDEYINPEISPAAVLEFIGGEPFLAVDVMDAAADYWFDRCIELRHPWAERTMLSVCSNGVAYRDPRVQRWLARHAHHLSFSVTVDGTEAMHDSCRVFPDGRGSYRLASAAALDWMARGGRMGSKITIAPGNVGCVAEAVRHMLSMGYDEVLANCVYEAGWNAAHARELYRQMKRLSQWFLDEGMEMDGRYHVSLFDERAFRPKSPDDVENWCGGNGVMLACDWDGRIYPCIRYMEMSLGGDQPPMVLGDVEGGILRKPEHRACYECLKKVDRRTQSSKECFDCPIAEGCSWCTAYNYQVSGTPDWRATYICPMHKARALANAWFWPRYRRQHGDARPYTLYVPDEWALEIVEAEELEEIKGMCA